MAVLPEDDSMTLDTTQELVDELLHGRMVVLADAEDR